MLRDGEPSHALNPKITRAKRSRDRISPLVSRMRASRRIPPIGGYGAPLAAAAGQRRPQQPCGRSQILPKRFRKLQAASRRGVVKRITLGDDAPRERQGVFRC
jgi:hypothetical protein